MEEKLSDNICIDAFTEFYIRKNYIVAIEKSKKAYKLLIKNEKQDYKDKYYIWMLLLIIIKSYKRIGKIENSFKYIMLSLRQCENENYRQIEVYRYLIKYYNKTGNNVKALYYLNKYVYCCNKIEKYQAFSEINVD